MAAEENILQPILRWGTIGLGGYFGIIKPLLKKAGVLDPDEEKKKKLIEEARKSPAFNRFFWVEVNNQKLPNIIANEIKTFGASQIAQKYKNAAKVIKKAMGFFNDDESVITAVFKSQQTKIQISVITDYYFSQNTNDLYTTMKSKLSLSEFAEIVEYINLLPDLLPKK